MNYKNRPVATQIGLVAFIVTMIIFSLLGSISYRSASHALSKKAEVALQAQMHSTANLIELQYDSLLALAQRNANVFRAMYPGDFHKPDRSVKVMGKATPALMHEREQINASKSKVDRYSKLTGGNATVFVRDSDHFTRIATSLKKPNGKRALGTYLSQHHPGYAALLKGLDYQGYARLFSSKVR